MVFLVGMEEGILPHKSSYLIPHGIEEERRLAYVGLTRAKEDLVITYCHKRHSRASDDSAQHGPSRILEELPDELIDRSNKPVQARTKEQQLSSIDTALEMLKALG